MDFWHGYLTNFVVNSKQGQGQDRGLGL